MSTIKKLVNDKSINKMKKSIHKVISDGTTLKSKEKKIKKVKLK